MNNNLNVWNQVKQTPQNFLKPIGFGALKGKSDINPQWRLMAMTQAFGQVGHGWTYRIVRTWAEQAEDKTIMCFCEVAVKTKVDGNWGEEFSGIGGSTIQDKNKNGLQPNDEGYKKATTDALGVAFKAVGVAADIYLGNFDGSKYQFNYDHAFPEPQATQATQATQANTANKLELSEERFKDALEAIKKGGYKKADLLKGFALTLEQKAQVEAL